MRSHLSPTKWRKHIKFLKKLSVKLPENNKNILTIKLGKPDTPACEIASKSFPVPISALSNETGWSKKLKG